MKFFPLLTLLTLGWTAAAAAQPEGKSTAISVGQHAVAAASASFHCINDSINSLNDGRESGSSRDSSIPHLSFYPRVGTFEWLQYDFPVAQNLEGCEVYWYDDQQIAKKSAKDRGIGLPDFWKVLYQNAAGEWLPVAGKPPAPFLDGWNVCRFKPVQSKSLRLAVQQSSLASAAIMEWKVIPSTVPRVVDTRASEEIGLDDLIPFSAAVGNGSYRVDKYSLTEEKRGTRVLLDGLPCGSFLFTHANSVVSFQIPQGFTKFTCTGIGPTRADWTNYSWSYQVLADGKLLHRTELLSQYPNHQAGIEVDLPAGAKTLTLITDGSGNVTADHSIWANPRLLPLLPSVETKTKLAQLATQFNAASTKALQPLKGNYQAAVKRALETAQKNFNADAIAALDQELKSLEAGQPLPQSEAPDVPPVLAKLRTSYRSAIAEASASATSPIAQLQDRYEAALANLLGSVAQNPADASAVNAVRAQLAADRAAAAARAPNLAGDAAPAKAPAIEKTPSAVPVVKASSMAQLRQLAEKVLSLNPNGLKLIVERQLLSPTKLPLPAGAFEIQEIGVGGAPAKAITDEDLDLLGAGRSAQIIQLNDASLSRLDGLRPHAGLRILSFNGTSLADDALKALEGMRVLEQLHLNGTKISGPGLLSLAGCTKLTVLSLWGTQVNDAGLTHAGRLRSLTRLNLGNSKITGSGLTNLSGMPNLVYLGLDGLALSPGCLDGLPQLKHLAELDLSSVKLTSELLSRTGSLTGLETLLLNNTSLNGNPLTDADLRELAGLAKLKQLSLAYTAVTGTGLAALGKAKNLESLSIAESSALTDEGVLVALKTFPSLNALALGGKVTAASLGSLNQSTKLKTLTVNGPTLTDAAVLALPSMRNLESLELHAPGLTSAAAPALARQPKLTRLHLSGTRLNDEAVPVLGSIKTLKELNLSGLSISSTSLEKLKRSLPACNIVR